ncbi:unnamed protein product [Clavelina lepadiformis]|uniref:EGF-like domain-containing protein n=1 Tax=Clavelina lepadiformis TaxID=159417 RepID=A0ABP0GZ31_CLALP
MSHKRDRFFTSHIPFHSNHTHMKNYVHGHYTALRNPRLTFSVLQPAGQGCDGNSTATVKDTSKTRRCIVAQNGGFYVSRTGACLGNIVSDGRLIRNSHGVQNAHFGITRNGTIIVGYLSEKDVKTLDFQQLVGGVIWMIRNGASYIDEAVQLEEESTQETGTLRYFADVQTGRSAIGHDSNGQVVFVQVDGRTKETGVNLEAFAKYLIDEFQLVNAINLDGGGSATVVINDTLVSYSSDYCKNTPKWWCPRPVSTVICAHSPDCEPACENGQCVDGSCICENKFRGETCSVLKCGFRNCSNHGSCNRNGCSCDSGWHGSDCSLPSPRRRYGTNSSQICYCENNPSCNSTTGESAHLSGLVRKAFNQKRFSNLRPTLSSFTEFCYSFIYGMWKGLSVFLFLR